MFFETSHTKHTTEMKRDEKMEKMDGKMEKEDKRWIIKQKNDKKRIKY